MASTRDYLGSYRLIKLIRSGNSCHVWEAAKDGDKERVALKVPLEKYKGDKHLLEELKHEATVGQSLEHPDVIKIFEFSSRHRLPYISMQLYNARNLKQELREQSKYVAFNLEEIIERCANGLAHMHDRGWVHCDVKPDNYLCDENANLKLIDFSISRKPMKTGLAGWFAAKPKTLQGTRSYMAPEQIQRKAITPKTDQYGLGCTIFELMTGKPPFTGNTPDELLRKHISSATPSVQVFNKTISNDMVKLVVRLMEKNPANRFADLHEFLKYYKVIRVYKAGLRPKT